MLVGRSVHCPIQAMHAGSSCCTRVSPMTTSIRYRNGVSIQLPAILATSHNTHIYHKTTHKQYSSVTKHTKEVLDATPNAPALLLAFPVGVLSLVTSTSAVPVQVIFDIIHLLVSRRNRPSLLTIVLRPASHKFAVTVSGSGESLHDAVQCIA